MRKIATPVGTRPTDKRFLGNSNPSRMEVHDLENKDASPTGCQIDEIITAGHAVVFYPDTLQQAYTERYDSCAYCIGASTR